MGCQGKSQALCIERAAVAAYVLPRCEIMAVIWLSVHVIRLPPQVGPQAAVPQCQLQSPDHRQTLVCWGMCPPAHLPTVIYTPVSWRAVTLARFG